MSRRSWSIVLLAVLCAAGCGTTPTSPTVTAAPITGPRILLAGQSSAYFLGAFLPEAIDLSNIDGSINYWLSSRDFADRARTAPLLAFVWWQGGNDVAMSGEEYAQKLRALIEIARSGNAALPVRIVELADFPIRAHIREAQRRVATDPGVELIPTSDLPCADPACHLTPAGYQTVRDRIYRSLGK